MFSRLFVSVLATSFFSFNALAINGANPFAKSEVLNVGKDVAWEINKDAGVAVKSAVGEDDSYYHLEFDNRQIKLTITSDKEGQSHKYFSQLEIKDLKINGKQSSLFKWCLNNQQKHSRFLQQGLTVKNNVCQLNANNGSFIMRLNKATLSELQKGSNLEISLKPFRTQLDIKYDISDFAVMYTALNAKPVAVRVAPVPAVSKPVTMCKENAPAKYKQIKSIEYKCIDVVAKANAQVLMTQLVSKEDAKQKQVSAEREKQRKLAEEKKQEQLAAKLQEEERIRVEVAALAASQEKQAQLGSEISMKMIGMCEKFWTKGEHRCYCQKYIEHAPSEIQANSTCN